MKDLIVYLLEMFLVSSIFYLTFLLIRNHTTPFFKRIYLGVWLISSIGFPLITVQSVMSSPVEVASYIQPGELEHQRYDEFAGEKPLPSEEKTTNTFPQQQVSNQQQKRTRTNSNQIILGLYVCVSVFLLFRIILGVVQVVRLRNKSFLSYVDNIPVYEVDDSSFSGASFFGWIFIGKDLGQTKNSIIRHELKHRKLFHSIDVMVVHIYCAIFWVNPIAWVLKKQVGLNAELEVDNLLCKEEGTENYANVLLGLTERLHVAPLLNHFSAKHLKARIIAMSSFSRHRQWVSVVAILITMITFGVVSCEAIDDTANVISDERLGEIKSITTRFTSHQSDTQQKNGKIVSIATFNVDGTIDEFVSKTTYPYDRDYELKKEFWEEPIRKNLFYIMDGLSMRDGEKSLLYGNDWPKAYYKYLMDQSTSEVRTQYTETKISTDDVNLPNEISIERLSEHPMEILMRPDAKEFFEYDGGKVIKVEHMNVYKEVSKETFEKLDINGHAKKFFKPQKAGNGEKKLVSSYEYEGDLLKAITTGKYKYIFYYDNNTLAKSEYYINDILVNTRLHYYENGLKDRTEIFNVYNEPEYTISYEYEFW